MPVVTDYTALLSGSYWNGIEVTAKPVIVTYSFPTSAPAYTSGVGGFTAGTLASYQGFSTAQAAQARTALAEWSNASGLVFLEVAPGQGDLNFQLVDFNTTAGPSYAGAGGIGFYPFGNWNFFSYPYFTSDIDSSGDVYMNSQFVSGGLVNYGTLLHEIGHALGLKHPTEVVTDFAANPDVTHDQVLAADDPTLTIMATVGGGGDFLKQLDKDAIAFLYGTAGTGGVYTTSASGANAVVSAWSYDAALAKVTQSGFATDDAIRGTSIADVIYGLDGQDQLFGLNGDDMLYGGTGNDKLFGGLGVNRLAGGADDDFYQVEVATDVVVEGINQGYDSVFATVSFTLPSNVEQLQLAGVGLTGNGNTLANVLFGDGGNATNLYGGGGNDYMVGGAAADKLFGGGANDTIYGGDGADRILGDAGNDFLYGDGGDDAFDFKGTGTTNGVDVVDGGTGNDILRGGGTNANISVESFTNIERIAAGGFTGVTLSGSANANSFDLTSVTVTGITAINLLGGADVFLGSAAADNVFGGAGNDNLSGAGGNDVLTGGNDQDTLTGGANADTFDYNAVFESRFGVNADTITDFTPGLDKIDLAGIDSNTLVAGDQAFTFIGTAAFTPGTAGQLRIDTTSAPGQTWILGEVNGGGSADLHIILSNAAITAAADYIL